mmetsp:Transcript_5248/g.15632  ORF Transcript_5248/g.15632 Transcript_5248/m.15632 type:complete len:253 (+) Transcript_5248:402-1160(+)
MQAADSVGWSLHGRFAAGGRKRRQQGRHPWIVVCASLASLLQTQSDGHSRATALWQVHELDLGSGRHAIDRVLAGDMDVCESNFKRDGTAGNGAEKGACTQRDDHSQVLSGVEKLQRLQRCISWRRTLPERDRRARRLPCSLRLCNVRRADRNGRAAKCQAIALGCTSRGPLLVHASRGEQSSTTRAVACCSRCWCCCRDRRSPDGCWGLCRPRCRLSLECPSLELIHVLRRAVEHGADALQVLPCLDCVLV